MKTLFKKHRDPLLAFLLCLATYVPTFLWMKIRWFAKDSYYSHGVLIPFVVAYLIWDKREQLQGLLPYQATESRRWGIPLVLTGLVIHLISSILRVYFTSGFSFLLVLIGLVLHFYGQKTLKMLSFALFFLVFMLPLPEVVIVNISFRMKMFAAAMAAKVINQIGILAIREGSVIRMPHAYVVVDDVCSGLRSLISLAALGSLFAYFFKAPLWKKIILFVSTIPIAVITNMCRVVFLAFVSEIWGHEA
ncbi:MAG TPA: exosortase/archaeosortase family protein, partial [Candidatus Bathyarchaeia archaeon]|nr:exosortase/archaeosortase family protein [Candidatus Bathyarchaeia archaeon]